MEYLPTEMMITDLYANPLQDKTLKNVLNIILNINDWDAKNIICAKELEVKEINREGGPLKNDRSPQECLGRNDCTLTTDNQKGIYC